MAMRRRESGQSAVELAIVLPVLLMVMLGIVQFGTLFRDYIALTDATRVGARQASVARSLGGTDTFKTNAVIAATKSAGVNLSPTKMTVTVDATQDRRHYPRLGGGRSGDRSVGIPVQDQPHRLGLLHRHGEESHRGTR